MFGAFSIWLFGMADMPVEIQLDDRSTAMNEFQKSPILDTLSKLHPALTMDPWNIHIQELGNQQGGSSQGSPSEIARRVDRLDHFQGAWWYGRSTNQWLYLLNPWCFMWPRAIEVPKVPMWTGMGIRSHHFSQRCSCTCGVFRTDLLPTQLAFQCNMINTWKVRHANGSSHLESSNRIEPDIPSTHIRPITMPYIQVHLH